MMEPPGWPTADELAALRAWYAGLSARDAVGRYLGHIKASGQSSRSMLGTVRRQLAQFELLRGSCIRVRRHVVRPFEPAGLGDQDHTEARAA